MTINPAGDLQAMFDTINTVPFRVRQVTSVNDDGTVNVDYGGEIVPVPILASYDPSPGDKVLILVTEKIGWCVLGKVIGSANADEGLPSSPEPPELADAPFDPAVYSANPYYLRNPPYARIDPEENDA